MSKNKKPRKAYKPKPVSAETMTLAKNFAAKPSKEDRDEVLGLLSAALKALREGNATERQWSIVAGSVSVAYAIEAQGKVRGLLEHFKVADKALQDIYDRAVRMGNGKYLRATLYFNELDALALFFDLHKFQVKQLGRAEFLAAIDAAQKKTVAQGHISKIENNIERLAA